MIKIKFTKKPMLAQYTVFRSISYLVLHFNTSHLCTEVESNYLFREEVVIRVGHTPVGPCLKLSFR